MNTPFEGYRSEFFACRDLVLFTSPRWAFIMFHLSPLLSWDGSSNWPRLLHASPIKVAVCSRSPGPAGSARRV
jgi:hypothetical protein